MHGMETLERNHDTREENRAPEKRLEESPKRHRELAT